MNTVQNGAPNGFPETDIGDGGLEAFEQSRAFERISAVGSAGLKG
jgi:hypothetical protein